VDLTVTLGNLLTIASFAAGIVVLFMRDRTARARLEAEINARFLLLDQRCAFIEQTAHRDRVTTEGHWNELKGSIDGVNRRLDDIKDQLANKADRRAA
jgi:hypothetical protein